MSHIAQVKLLDESGKSLSIQKLSSHASKGIASVTIGRSFECDIVVNDPYVAAVHAQIEFDETGKLWLRDLNTVNGTKLGAQLIAGATLLSSAKQGEQEISIGRSKLSVHLQPAQLAPELPLDERAHAAAMQAGLPNQAGGNHWLAKLEKLLDTQHLVAPLALLAFGLTLASAWLLQTSQRDIWISLVTVLLSELAVLAVWVMLWALISRVARGEPRWRMHTVIALALTCVTYALGWLFDLGAFASSSILPGAALWWLYGALAALLLFLHLKTATRLMLPRVLGFAAILPGLVIGYNYWRTFGTDHGLASYQATSPVLLPPALRVITPAGTETFFEKAKLLKAEALRLRDKTKPDRDGLQDDFVDD